MAVMTSESFFASMTKLEAKEAAKTIEFVNRFMANPANPGISLERLNTKSKRLWSGRITQELRAIIFQDGEHWALLHAGHHDAAYRWAERRTVDKHPVTGILQVVETVEAAPEVQRIVTEPTPSTEPTFSAHEDDYLSSLGVPQDWLPTLRKVVNDEQLLTVIAKLPEEVSERLLNLADGQFVTPPKPVAPGASPLEHPDVRRRFFVTSDADELRHALEAPLQRWISFLHPSQRKLVEGTFKGPVKVTGSAGTGKTVVAMHRARHLARTGHEILLTSFVGTLCKNIERSLGLFCSDEELGRITVATVHGQALKAVRKVEPNAKPAKPDEVVAVLDQLAQVHAPGFEQAFIRAEWDGVIDPQGIRSWPEYRKARRTGRGKALSVSDRKTLWKVFGGVQAQLADRQLYDWPGMCRRAIELLDAGEVKSPYSAVIVDEVQDLKPPALRFLAALAAGNLERLMVVGDAGQRIYPGRFGLNKLGIHVRGRSHILRLNYRTTEQIRRCADRMLGQVTDDMDEGEEKRGGTRSLLSGPVPTMRGHDSAEAELAAGVTQVETWLDGGLAPEAIAVFARSGRIGREILEAFQDANIRCHRLVDNTNAPPGAVRVGTMHRAKGLEFKAVLLFGCTKAQLPNEYMLGNIDDPQDRDDAVERDRRLFYVAMTRARDELTISWSGQPSPFLDVLR